MAAVSVSKLDIIDICRRIIMSFPYDPCVTINTFTTVDNGDDLEVENVKKTFADYEQGFFWSRDWVLSGVNKDNLKKQYPIFALEHKTSTKKSLRDKESCHSFWGVILDTPDCKDCPDECKRPIDQIDCDIRDLAEAFMAEFVTYCLYEIEYEEGGSLEKIWLSENQVEYWKENNMITYSRKIVDILLYLQDKQVEIFPTEVGGADNARAVAFEFVICSCTGDKKQFNYSKIVAKQVSTAKCSAC